MITKQEKKLLNNLINLLTEEEGKDETLAGETKEKINSIIDELKSIKGIK